MIPCLKTRRALLRRVLYVSAMRARLTARAKPSSLWILPHRNRALETSQKICLSAPAFPCRARESKSCQVQYPQRLRPRCPPSSASVRDCTANSSSTLEKERMQILRGGREKADLNTCWSGQTACTWPQHAAPPALSNSRPQGQWAFTTPVCTGSGVLAKAERGTLLHPYLQESEESKAVREARRSRIPQKNHPESEAA